MSTALELIKGDSLPEILKGITRTAAVAIPADRTLDLPKVVVLTDEARAAMETLRSASLVQVDARRSLTAAEVESLLNERAELDKLEAFIKARKEAHRSMVANHLDIEIDGRSPLPEAELDDKGHWLVKGSVTAPGHPKRYSWELREASPTLTAEALHEIEGETFTHDDYLACTTQVRVLDEAKFLLLLRNRPEVIESVRGAIEQGKTTGSLYVRKA